MTLEFPGAYSGGATPVPIPNTEVKPSSADGTARETVWESRSAPGNLYWLGCVFRRTRAFFFFVFYGAQSDILKFEPIVVGKVCPPNLMMKI